MEFENIGQFCDGYKRLVAKGGYSWHVLDEALSDLCVSCGVDLAV